MSTAQRLACIEGASTLAITGGAILAFLPTTPSEPLWIFAARVTLLAAICVACFYYNDLYDFELPHDFPRLFSRVCRALGVAALLLAATYLLFPRMVISGNVAPPVLVATLVAVLLVRAAVLALATRPPFSRRVLLLGDGPLAAELAEHIRTRPDLASTLAAVVAPGCDDAELTAAVRRHRADHIIVALRDRRGALPLSALLECRVRGARVEQDTDAFERFTRRLAVQSLTPSALVFGEGFQVSRLQLALQRAVSLAAVGVGALVALPLIALIVLAIKIDSRGPVLFVQERIGLRGRPFKLLKFRTMHPAAPSGDAVWRRDNTSRVTRVGRLLRRYRLDELPQFVNILRGDMNLVGPRPEMASNVATLATTIPYYSLRHEVRPGLTGWAQIRAGYSMSTEEVTRKLCYDLYYVKHMSLAFDFRILIDTVKFVLSGKRPG